MSFARWKLNHTTTRSEELHSHRRNNGKDFNRRLNKSYAPCAARPFVSSLYEWGRVYVFVAAWHWALYVYIEPPSFCHVNCTFLPLWAHLSNCLILILNCVFTCCCCCTLFVIGRFNRIWFPHAPHALGHLSNQAQFTSCFYFQDTLLIFL